MAVEIVLARGLREHVDAPESAVVEGATVGEALAALAGELPEIRKFVLDDQGRLRQHVNVFVNEAVVQDREGLSDGLEEGDRLYVAGAVSGGADRAAETDAAVGGGGDRLGEARADCGGAGLGEAS